MDNLSKIKKIAAYENSNQIGTIGELEKKFLNDFKNNVDNIFFAAYRTYDTTIHQTKWKSSVIVIDKDHNYRKIRIADDISVNKPGSLWIYSF